MLILSRKENEAIVLITPQNQKIVVRLTKYVGQETKLSIDAPCDILILREELTQRPTS